MLPQPPARFPQTTDRAIKKILNLLVIAVTSTYVVSLLQNWEGGD
jgi:hypothetical protein